MAGITEIGLPPAKEETSEELNGIALPPKRKEEEKAPLRFPNSGVDWQTFSEGAQIDDKKAAQYEDAMLNTMAFDIPTEQTFRDKKAIDKSISRIPFPKHKKEIAQNTYDGISLVGNPISNQGANSKAMGFFEGINILNNHAKVLRSETYKAWMRASNRIGASTFAGIEIAGQEIAESGVDSERLGVWEQMIEPESEAVKRVRIAVGKQLEFEGKVGREFLTEQAEQEEWAQLRKYRGKNIVDNPELMADPIYLFSGMTELMPYFAVAMATGGAGAKTIKLGGQALKLSPALIDKAAKMGLALFSGAAGGHFEGSSDYEQALKMGKSPQESREAYYRMTLASAGLNAFSFNLLLNKIPEKAKGKVFEYLTKSPIGRAVTGYFGEGAPEGLEEIFSSINLTGKVGQSWKEALTVMYLAGPSGAGTALVTGATAEGLEEAAQEQGADVTPVTKTFEDKVKDAGLEHMLEANRTEEVADIAPTAKTTVTEGIADISAQVETGTLTEEQAVESIITRLIEPIRGEEGAITIGREPEMTPQERETAIDRGLAQFRETGEIDMASPVADEIIAESLILDELGAEGTAQTVMEARRRAEIEARGREQASIRQGKINEILRQEAIDRELTLFSETGEIDLNSPVALDVIKANILNEAYTVRDNFNDILDIGRSILSNERGAIGRPTQTDTPAFKAWFKDSKVVDDNGEPLVVYHGTSGAFAEFDPKQVGANFGVDAEGFYFTENTSFVTEKGRTYEDPYSAGAYAKNAGNAPNIMPVYLSIKNPLTVEDIIPAYYLDPLDPFDGAHPQDYLDKNKAEMIDRMKEEGKDGIIFKWGEDSVFVVFSPTQIKSATGNVGTFGPTVADIRGEIDFNADVSIAPLQEFLARMKEVLGEAWEKVKPYLKTAWDVLNNERGAIGREGKPKAPKTQIRQATGQVKDAELRDLERSLKRQEQVTKEAEKAGRRNLEAEQEIDNIKRQIGTIKQQIARTTGLEKNQELRDLARSLLRQEGVARAAEREGRRDEAQKVRERIKEQMARAKGKTEETAARNKLRSQIKKMLKTTKPRKEGGKPVGKFTPEVQRALDKLREAANLDKDAATDRIKDNIEKYPDEIPPEDIALENRVLSIVHGVGFYGQIFSNELAQIRDEIREMMDEGRMMNELKRFNRESRWERQRGEAIDVITGGEGIPAGADLKTRKTNYERIHGLTDRAKRWFATTGKTIVGWKDILDILSRLDPSKPFESDLSKMGDVLDAKNAEKQGIRDALATVQDIYREAFGITAEGRAGDRQTVKKMQEDTKPIDLGVFTDLEGNSIPLEISRAEARKRYMEFKDPTLDSTFTEGMAYTEAMKSAIVDVLTPQDKAFAEAQMAFYQEYYNSINDVYRDLYGVDLPQNPNYSPIRREGFKRDEGTGFGEFLQEINFRATTTPGGLKSREANIKPISFESDMSVMQQHLLEMEHFKAWAERVRDLRAILNDVKVKDAIAIYHGKDIQGVVDNFIDDFARGGVNRGLTFSWLDRWRGRIARSVLAIKASIGAKQLTSFVAYADSMPTADFIKYTAEFWKNPIENTRLIYDNSTLLKTRRQHMERDIQQAQKSDAYKAWRKGQSALDMLMINIHLGDEGAIVMGGWPLIKYHMDKGASLDEAIKKFEQVTESTQQSADLSELSVFQRGGSFAKLFTLYRSSPNQYIRKEMAAIRNLISGRQGVGQTAKTIAIFHLILPMLFQFVSDGFTWDEEEQERALIFGPLNGIFIIGDILDGIVRASLDMRVYDSEIPMMSIGDDAIRVIKAIQDDDLTDEEFLRAIRGFAGATGAITGVPLRTAVDIGVGVDEILTGDYEQGAAQVLGWSPSAAKKIAGGEKKGQRRR
jgi:hypothetical protein